MTIDKSKLQSLLWAVVGAWKTGDQGLHLHTDALDEFLGASTVEEVALGLLEEIDQLKAENAGLRTGYQAYEDVNAGLKAEIEALRKEAVHD